MANTTISQEQAALYAWEAGFRGNDLVTILEIANAESGLATNPPGNANHYGILQFAAPTISSVGGTIQDALNPQQSFVYAKKLVDLRQQQGASDKFTDWTADIQSRGQFADIVGKAIVSLNGSPSQPIPNPGDILGGAGNAIGGAASAVGSIPGDILGIPNAVGNAVSGAIVSKVKAIAPYVILSVAFIVVFIMLLLDVKNKAVSEVVSVPSSGNSSKAEKAGEEVAETAA